MQLTPEQKKKRIAEIEAELKQQIIIKKEHEKKILKERNRIYDAIRLYHGRFLVMIGGAGSGKSYEAADRVIDRIVEEPKIKTGIGHRILCVRRYKNDVSSSQFPALRDRALKRYPDEKWIINKASSNESIALEQFDKNGKSIGENIIIFAGLDDVAKLKSIFDITSVWIEEANQITAEDFEELNRRLRVNGVYNQIMLTFNPVNISNWINGRFFKGKGKRTICLCGKQPFDNFESLYVTETNKYKETIKYDFKKTHTYYHERAKREVTEFYYNTLLLHTTYIDNQYLPAANLTEIDNMAKYSPFDYNVYALGQWGVMGGTFLDARNINKRKLEMEKYLTESSLTRGYFEFDYENDKIIDSTIKWVNDGFGYITIYEEPKINTPYVIGSDTAGEGSDWQASMCIDNISGKDVASIHIEIDEDLYTRQIYCLGKYFGKLNNCSNNALIGVEINFGTHPIKELQRWRYDNLYVRETTPDNYSGALTQRYGVHTNRSTRPLMLGMLRKEVREQPDNFRDLTFLNEALTFVKNEKGKPEAMDGQHDDMIMARAITLLISDQQFRTERDTYKAINIHDLPNALQDDYYNTPSSQRTILLERWRELGMV